MSDPKPLSRRAPENRELRPFGMDIILPGSQTPPEVKRPTAAKPLAGGE
jgi:hypothetical protein